MDVHHRKAWFDMCASKANPIYRPADGTYELIGPPIGANHEGVDSLILKQHGDVVLDDAPFERTFESLKEFLGWVEMEGIVFTHPDGRMCKIRRNDYGIPWGVAKRAG